MVSLSLYDQYFVYSSQFTCCFTTLPSFEIMIKDDTGLRTVTMIIVNPWIEIYHCGDSNYRLLILKSSGSVVSLSAFQPGGCEFYFQLRQTFFPAFSLLSPLLKDGRKVVNGFRKEVVLVLVRKSRETHVGHRPP